MGRKKATHCKRGHERTPENVDKWNACKICHLITEKQWKKDNSERYKARVKKHYNENKPQWKAWQIKTQLFANFKLTVEQYTSMVCAQGGRCAICKKIPKIRLAVDHNHACCDGKRTCGKCIRGLVCNPCNTLLSRCNDDISTLESAIEYLKKYQELVKEKILVAS